MTLHERSCCAVLYRIVTNPESRSLTSVVTSVRLFITAHCFPVIKLHQPRVTTELLVISHSKDRTETNNMYVCVCQSGVSLERGRAPVSWTEERGRRAESWEDGDDACNSHVLALTSRYGQEHTNTVSTCSVYSDLK